VAGVDRRVLGEGENFFANARKELIPVAPRKIPAADPIRKENIAAKKLVGGRKIKAEAAGAVPGDVEEFGLGPFSRHGAGFVQEPGGSDRAETLGEAEGEHGVGLEAEEGGVGVVVDGATGPVGEVCSIPNVVPVSVGEEEGVGLDFFLFEKAEKAFRSVDGEAVIAELQKVGVGGGEAARKDQRFRHENSPFSLDEDED
jgi:hypothetical protein